MHGLIPVSAKTLASLQPKMSSGNKEVLNMVSIIVGRVIWETNKEIPCDGIKGILYGSCLVHIGMFGLAPVK